MINDVLVCLLNPKGEQDDGTDAVVDSQQPRPLDEAPQNFDEPAGPEMPKSGGMDLEIDLFSTSFRRLVDHTAREQGQSKRHNNNLERSYSLCSFWSALVRNNRFRPSRYGGRGHYHGEPALRA